MGAAVWHWALRLMLSLRRWCQNWVEFWHPVQIPGQVRSMGWKDCLEEGMATHSHILAWRILWTEEPGGLWSMKMQRAGHDWSDWAHTADWLCCNSFKCIAEWFSHSFSYLGCYTILSRVPCAIQCVFGSFYLLRKDSNTLFFNLEITLLLHESFSLFG